MLRTVALLIGLGFCSLSYAAGAPAPEILRSLGTDPGDDKVAAIALVEATAKIYGIEEANALIDSLGIRFPAQELREKLVASCADMVNFDCAYYEASRIEPFNWRVRALSQIASAYAEQGDMERARSAFLSLAQNAMRDSPPRYRNDLLNGLIGSLSEFGFIDIGLDAARSITDPSVQAEALFSLSIASARLREARASDIYTEAVPLLKSMPNPSAWLLAHAAVAAVAANERQAANSYFVSLADVGFAEWAYGQIAVLLQLTDRGEEAQLWLGRIKTDDRRDWALGFLAESVMKIGQCSEALDLSQRVVSVSWSVATLLHLAEENQRQTCVDGATFADRALALFRGLERSDPAFVTLGARLAVTVQAATPAVNALDTGRARWQCTAEPIIYPGWWDQAINGLPDPAGPDSTDGNRATAPDVVQLGQGASARYYLYYMAETGSQKSMTRILRTEISPMDPTSPRPGNVALEFYGPTLPDNGIYDDEAFLRVGPYYGATLPALDEAGEPARKIDGTFEPWFMYIAVRGNNLGVAVSTDGGITFSLPDEQGINPIFPFEVFKEPSGGNGWRRQPIEAENKLYDQNGSGSGSVVKTSDGRYHLFYTALMWNYYTLDDLGAQDNEIFHKDGQIPDHGIGYAVSDDGLHWTRRTAMALGVTSPAAKGTGRIIDPRFRDGAPGELEYTVTRPMVFADGVDATSGKTRYRMLVSSHSSTYRVRSLHSTDLINWTWDPSPTGGLFGLGAPGSFDDKSTAYGDCIREINGDGDQYMCWYTGNGFGHFSAGKTGIGFCTMPVSDRPTAPAPTPMSAQPNR